MTLQPLIVKERILLHLLGFTKFAGAYDVPADVTQEGIARATWIDLPHVLQYVRPLLKEGLVRERTAHVRGGRRRRKSYELSEAGQLRAYSLRTRLKSETVLVRGAGGTHEQALGEVLDAAGPGAALLDILREFVHAGSVDVSSPRAPVVASTVRFLRDAPSTEGFVGRRAELDAIVGAEGAPRVLVVRGVAGIGKSTLAAKACNLLGGTHHILWHRVQPWDTAQSFLADAAGFLAALGKPSLRGTLAQGNLQGAFRVLREDLAGLKALLVLDDAHDATPEFLSVVRTLKDAVAQVPSVRLLLLTRRSLRFYDRRDVVLSGLVREIDLRGLDPKEVQSVFAPEGPSRASLDLGGHPLFIKLVRAAGPGEAPAGAIRDVHRFIEEAIYGELSDRERRLLKLASLYRVAVPEAFLLPDPSSSRDDIARLSDRALLTVVGDGNLEVHDALRAFFLGILTEGERTDLGRFATNQLVAHARKSADAGSLAVAVGYLSNALAVAPSGAETLLAAEALGDSLETIGDFSGSTTSYRRAFDAAGDPAPRARLRRKIASILLVQGAFREAGEELERGFELLGPEDIGERGWLHLTRCRVSIRMEEWEEALQDGRAALGSFQASGEVAGQGQALYQIAHAEANRRDGDPVGAQRLLETALALSDTLPDPRFLATVHAELAYLCAYRLGDVPRAQNHLAAADALVEAVPSPERGNLEMLKGTIDLWVLGDLPRAEADFRGAMAIADKLGSAATHAYARYALSLIAFYRGRYAESLAALEPLAREFEKMGAAPTAFEAIGTAAECSLLEGDIGGFLRLMGVLGGENLRAGREARAPVGIALEALRELVEGRAERTLELLDEAVARSQGSSPPVVWYPHFVRALVLEATGCPKEAATHRETAMRILRTFSRQADLDSIPRREELLLAALKASTG